MSGRNRRKAKKAARFNDGLESMSMRLGARQNAMLYSRGKHLTERKDELDALWFEDWVTKKITGRRSADMTRKWRTVYSSGLDASQVEKFERLEKRLKLRGVIRQAHQWASLYGTGAIVIETGVDAELPIGDSEAIKRLIAVDRHSLSVDGEKESNLLSQYYGQPEFYRIKNSPQKIHRSRVIPIHAGERPPSDSEKLWGVSDMEPVYATLKRYDMLGVNIGDLVTESKIDIFKMDGFSDKVMAGLEDEIIKIMSAVQSIKSSTNSLLLDKDAEYEQKELTFTGLKDLYVEFRNAVAGAADMPVTFIFGQSASGFATGQEDRDNYNDGVNSLQESRLRPALERLDGLLCNQLFGGMPDDWWFDFNPLGEMTAETAANVLNTTSTALCNLLDRGVIAEATVLKELKHKGLLTTITDEDIKAAEGLAKLSGDDPYGFTATSNLSGEESEPKPETEASNAVEEN